MRGFGLAFASAVQVGTNMSNSFSQYTPANVRFTIKSNQQRRLRELVKACKAALDGATQRATAVHFDPLPARVVAPIAAALREMGFGVTGIDECESRVNYFDVALNVKALVIVVPESPQSEDHDRGSTPPPVSAEPAHAVCSENEAAAVLQALLPHIEAGAFCVAMPRPWSIARHDDWTGLGTPHVWTLIADGECFAHLPHTVDGPALVKYVNAIGSVGAHAGATKGTTHGPLIYKKWQGVYARARAIGWTQLSAQEQEQWEGFAQAALDDGADFDELVESIARERALDALVWTRQHDRAATPDITWEVATSDGRKLASVVWRFMSVMESVYVLSPFNEGADEAIPTYTDLGKRLLELCESAEAPRIETAADDPASSNDALEVCRLLIMTNEGEGPYAIGDETPLDYGHALDKILAKAYAVVKAADA